MGTALEDTIINYDYGAINIVELLNDIDKLI